MYRDEIDRHVVVLTLSEPRQQSKHF